MEAKDIKKIEQKLGYTFKNKKLLEQAFTRSSFTEENGGENNEVLELWGDGIAKVVVEKTLSEKYSQITKEGEYATRFSVGELSEFVNMLVCNQVWAECITRLELQTYLRMGKGEIKNKQQNQESVKANLFEAIVGAVGIDSQWDFKQAEKVVLKMLLFEELLGKIVEKKKPNINHQKKPIEDGRNSARNQLNVLYTKKMINQPVFKDEQRVVSGQQIWISCCSVKGYPNISSVRKGSKAESREDAAYKMLCCINKK
jgi:dsRNA-specific ribonuclease